LRIFIAGGSGVLGRAAIPHLIAAGHEVTATTRSTTKAVLLRRLGARPVIVDAFERSALLAVVHEARPEAMVHLLTDLTTGDSASNALLRTTGTRNLVAAARHAGVRRIVAESISWVYPSGDLPADETDRLDLNAAEPRRTTIAAVNDLETAVLEFPDGVVLRFGQVYGPGTWFSREGRFGQDARAGRLAATETVASFIHISDTARAVLLALGWAAGIWNIVDDEPAAGTQWVPRFAAAVDAPHPAVSNAGDVGRPVSNARAHDSGFDLGYPSWREGFQTL
jgi:nucleoside-diphosphate-sugar epimerase